MLSLYANEQLPFLKGDQIVMRNKELTNVEIDYISFSFDILTVVICSLQ
jgi:hypothetical protein